jgi:uracil phosphoribosyltransferase
MKCIPHLLTALRDHRSDKVKFVAFADRLMSILCEEGLSYVAACASSADVNTPTGQTVTGVEVNTSNVVAISIIRAGDSLLDNLLRICPDISAGKILIQRDEETALPKLFYSKLPSLVNKCVILVDPMLATGGSANEAIRVLLANGAQEENIYFFNVVCCPEGIANLHAAFPNVTVVSTEMDQGLNERSYIVPGLGDYGDRYYGTA